MSLRSGGRRRHASAPLVLLSLALFPAANTKAGAPAPVVADLNAVAGIEQLPQLAPVRSALMRSGFVVVPAYQARTSYFYAAFGDRGLPHFVTTDSVYDAFHAILEDQLARVEQAHAAELASFGRAMVTALRRMSPGTAGRDLALALFQVGNALAAETMEDDLPRVVRDELSLILAAEGERGSPLFGRLTDYARFRPSGLYAGNQPALERTWRVMTWYSGTTLRLISDEETDAALAIATALGRQPEAQRLLQHIDHLYAKLLGPSDDLTPGEYAQLTRGLARRGTPATRRAGLRERAASLRDPRTPLFPLSTADADWAGKSKGLRILGRRTTADTLALAAVSWPSVRERLLPSGLDLLAANGSTRAADLLAGDRARAAGLDEGRRAAAAFLAEAKRGPATAFAETLKLLETLSSPVDGRAPPFARTQAWADKNVTTGLGTWALLRHAFQLMDELNVVAGAAPMPPKIAGFVEPNAAFFARMQALIAVTTDAFSETPGVDLSRLRRLGRQVEMLAKMVDKELAGTAFDREEATLLRHWGDELRDLINQGDRPKSLALIANVHRVVQVAHPRTLQVASGEAMPIFVVVPYDGRSWLLIGGVLSYFERAVPPEQELTDWKWKEQFARRAPTPPAWTASYLVQSANHPSGDVREALDDLRRRRRHESREDVELYDDDTLRRFTAQIVASRHASRGAVSSRKVLEVAARRLGRQTAPALLELIEFGTTEQAVDAAAALAHITDGADVPALRRIIDTKPDRSERAMNAVSPEAGCTHGFWAALLTAGRTPEVRREAAGRMGACARDATPVLLRAWDTADDGLRAEILESLGDLWSVRQLRVRDAPVHPIAPADLQRWRAEVRKLVLDVLARLPAAAFADEARGTAAALRIPEAIPLIDRTTTWNDLQTAATAAGTILAIGAPAGRSLLLRRLASRTPATRAGVAEALVDRDARSARSAWIPLLDDKAVVDPSTGLRVCDVVADAASHADIGETISFWTGDPLPERDRAIAAIKRLLAAPARVPRPTPAPR